jgi:hypothetical protein
MLGLQIPDKLLSLGPILQAWANTVGRRSRAWVVGSNLRAAISHHAKIDFADQLGSVCLRAVTWKESPGHWLGWPRTPAGWQHLVAKG